MRITLDIDDDVLAVAKAVAARERVSLGAALSALARGAFQRPIGIRHEGAIPVFDIPDDAAEITGEMVRDALSEP